jgi:hypothetical protein
MWTNKGVINMSNNIRQYLIEMDYLEIYSLYYSNDWNSLDDNEDKIWCLIYLGLRMTSCEYGTKTD